jgi:hypothetical protein
MTMLKETMCNVWFEGFMNLCFKLSKHRKPRIANQLLVDNVAREVLQSFVQTLKVKTIILEVGTLGTITT